MKIALRPFQLNSGRQGDRFVVESYRGLFSKEVEELLEAAISAAMLVTRLTLLSKTGNIVVFHVMTQALMSFIAGLNRPDDADVESDLSFVQMVDLWNFLDDNSIGGSTNFTLAEWMSLDTDQPEHVQV